MINFNDPVTRLVLGVVGIGVVILAITLTPFGVVALAALIAVIYYLVKRRKNV